MATEIPDIITETPPSTEGGTTEPVITVDVPEPAADDNRSFMDTLVAEAGTQMTGETPTVPEGKPTETPATEEKPPETPVTEDKPKETTPEEPAPKGMSKEAARVFKELKAELKTEREKNKATPEEIASREQRIAELQTAADQAEALREQLKAANDQLLEQQQAIELIKVESSSVWKNEVATPIEQISTAAGALAKEYDLNEGVLLTAIMSGDKAKLSEVIADLPAHDQFEAHTLRKKYSDVIAHRESLKEKGGERLNQLRAEQEKQETQEREQVQVERTRQIAGALPAVEKNISRFLETDEDKGRFAQALTIAKQDSLHTYPAHVQAAAVLAIGAMPILVRRLDASAARIAQLEGDIAGYRKSDPGAGGGGQQQTTESTQPFDEGDNFMSALDKSVRATQGR